MSSTTSVSTLRQSSGSNASNHRSTTPVLVQSIVRADGSITSSIRPQSPATLSSSSSSPSGAGASSSSPSLGVPAEHSPLLSSQSPSEASIPPSPVVQLATSPGSAGFSAPANRRLVVIYSVLLLTSSVMNSISFKWMTNAMPNYMYFLNQFTSFLYLPIFWGAVAYELVFTKFITKEQLRFPKLKFAMMGLFDALSGLIGLFGAVHTSGSVQALLANSVIPVTMWLSVLILKAKYSLLEYAGSAIIMTGIVIVMIPTIWPSLFSSAATVDSDNGLTETDSPLFNLLFLLSVVPAGLSSIYKEVAFVDTDMDVNFMNAWVALWQLMYGFLLIPLNALPFLGSQYVPFSQLWSAFVNGWLCFIGENRIVPPNCVSREDLLEGCINDQQLPLCDQCEGSWLPLALFMFFNTLFNTFTVLLVKYGGSTLMFIIMTMRLPIIQVAFSLSFVQNPPDAISPQTVIALLFILAGLAVYKWPVKTSAELAAEPLSVIMPIPAMVGSSQGNAMQAVRHEKIKILLHLKMRDSKAIRNQFYQRLGVISSPARTRFGVGGRMSPLPPSTVPAVESSRKRGATNTTDHTTAAPPPSMRAASPAANTLNNLRQPQLNYGSLDRSETEESLETEHLLSRQP